MNASVRAATRIRAVRVAVGGTAALAILAPLAACGGGSADVVRPPSPVASTSHPPVRSSPGSSSPAVSPTGRTSPPRHQTVTVTPHSGLRDGQQVRVAAAGFSPDEPLQVIECADRGKATAPGDCNLTGMLSVTSDASGRLQVRLEVVRGPFGTNRIVCSPTQHCLVSVTQAAMQPTEEADAPISFAG